MIVEYSLKDIDTSIGVGEYQITESLPDNLKSVLPTVEEIEAELFNVNVPAISKHLKNIYEEG